MASFAEILAYSWEGMTLKQKVVAAVIPVLLAAVVLTGWIRSGQLYFETRRLERQAAHAEADRDAFLAEAATLASAIRKREEELAQKEAVIDEELEKLPAVVQRRVDAERKLDDVRSNPRADAPTADDLCRTLANAGHPCR